MGKRRYRGTLKKKGKEQINLLEIKNSSKNQVKIGVLLKKYLNINRKSKLTLTNQEFKNDEIDFMKDFHIDGYDYILFFDGNFKNNISSNTFVVYDILKNNIYNQSKVYKCENSYESEFRALENGLKYLHKNQMITTVLIYGDCKSLISNSNEHFKSYLEKFRSHKIIWIKRDFLNFCDRLSRVVYDNYLINLTKPVFFEKRSNLRSSSKNIILNSDKRQFIEKKKIKKII
jgi:ribonuclease HI